MFIGARDQIRIHRKHCFRYSFEGYALSYSPLANRSYSQPTGYSPLFRWHALKRKAPTPKPTQALDTEKARPSSRDRPFL
jgi:hypothetical protein